MKFSSLRCASNDLQHLYQGIAKIDIFSIFYRYGKRLAARIQLMTRNSTWDNRLEGAVNSAQTENLPNAASGIGEIYGNR
jgi:hypothetical protein